MEKFGVRSQASDDLRGAGLSEINFADLVLEWFAKSLSGSRVILIGDARRTPCHGGDRLVIRFFVRHLDVFEPNCSRGDIVDFRTSPGDSGFRSRILTVYSLNFSFNTLILSKYENTAKLVQFAESSRKFARPQNTTTLIQ